MQNFYIFTIIAALFWAIYEIQIEGKNGWAANLPTWKTNNWFNKVFGWPYLDGYHLWLFILSLFIFYFPYFLNVPVNFNNELMILINYQIFIILEDFFWFIFNPNWGIKKFLINEIPWQKMKILGLPKNYWIGLGLLLMLIILKDAV